MCISLVVHAERWKQCMLRSLTCCRAPGGWGFVRKRRATSAVLGVTGSWEGSQGLAKGGVWGEQSCGNLLACGAQVATGALRIALSVDTAQWLRK